MLVGEEGCGVDHSKDEIEGGDLLNELSLSERFTLCTLLEGHISSPMVADDRQDAKRVKFHLVFAYFRNTAMT